MAISNDERFGKALDLLKVGLGPFVEREVKARTAHKRGHHRNGCPGPQQRGAHRHRLQAAIDTLSLFLSGWSSPPPRFVHAHPPPPHTS